MMLKMGGICKVQSVSTFPLFLSCLIKITRINCWVLIFGNSPTAEFESLGYKLQYRTTMAQDIHSVSSMVSGLSLTWTSVHTHHFHASAFCFINGNLWPVIQLKTAHIREVFQTAVHSEVLLPDWNLGCENGMIPVSHLGWSFS